MCRMKDGYLTENDKFPLPITDKNEIPIGPNMLRVDISDGQTIRTTDVVKRNGKLYNKLNHSYYFDKGIEADIVWLYPLRTFLLCSNGTSCQGCYPCCYPDGR